MSTLGGAERKAAARRLPNARASPVSSVSPIPKVAAKACYETVRQERVRNPGYFGCAYRVEFGRTTPGACWFILLAAEDEGLRCPQHLDWILAGRDDSLAIDARYAARGGWRAGILDFIDRYQVDVIHVNHAFEMLLAVRIRELVFRRTG